ncbi:glycosyltransferase [Deinococcus cellulosilyticus]|uniref:Glycosyl transferase family 1 n=1 Tax=Deinococcus cellulosilyticus (strain DSM 18568 / NBRC 106333 / KACC 11606 / 5516J-15) TaxID=1223518 RepID=A0A511MXH6_DEIC1|nr:glycosyltransferase [Deinococcus cellulosilyticus]GEM45269.1 glycosyl transferase family 1 [Deinococcus cellulosilyticus NBRC 106333 = KACC 11606]
MKLAYVHEWLVNYAGSEKVVEAMMEHHPAPIYTLVHDPEALKNTPLAGREIHPSFLQGFPQAIKRYQQYLPFMPLAVEQFDLTPYDVVVSSNHAVAKGARVRADQLHLSYVHTPIRYAWDLQDEYLRDAGLTRGFKAFVVKAILHYLRLWDTSSANRVDVFMANSAYVARRIWRTYRRKARVVYPPVDIHLFNPAKSRDDFFLTMSRMVSYKRTDAVVQACNELGLPLVVIGGGPDLERIRAMAGPTVKVMGRQSDEVVRDHMSRCRAFVFAADEDFGIATVEAQASGAPVLAYGRGGSTEIVQGGKTGLFFPDQGVASIKQTLQDFLKHPTFDSHFIHEQSQRFSRARFQQEFHDLLEQSWEAFRQGQNPEDQLFR